MENRAVFSVKAVKNKRKHMLTMKGLLDMPGPKGVMEGLFCPYTGNAGPVWEPGRARFNRFSLHRVNFIFIEAESRT